MAPTANPAYKMMKKSSIACRDTLWNARLRLSNHLLATLHARAARPARGRLYMWRPQRRQKVTLHRSRTGDLILRRDALYPLS